MGSTHGHHHAHGMLTTRAATASVATAIFLLLIKGYATWTTGSMAMLGSLADSGLDLVASLITLVGVRVAAMPADDDHRFGHGKAEALVALTQVGIIILSAIWIAWQSVTRFGTSAPVQAPEYGIAVSGVAIVATLALLAFQRRIIAQTGSVAIKTDTLHYSGDLALNAAVLVALAIEFLMPVGWIDPVAGVLIAMWLAKNAWSAATEAIDQLMDKEWPDDRKAALEKLALAHPEIRGIHDVRTRSSGAHDFVQFKAYVDPTLSLAAAHDIMDRVEDDLEHAFPGTEILIHPEPAPG